MPNADRAECLFSQQKRLLSQCPRFKQQCDEAAKFLKFWQFWQSWHLWQFPRLGFRSPDKLMASGVAAPCAWSEIRDSMRLDTCWKISGVAVSPASPGQLTILYLRLDHAIADSGLLL